MDFDNWFKKMSELKDDRASLKELRIGACDESFENLVHHYLSLDDADQEHFRGSIPKELGTLLRGFGTRIASSAYKEGRKELIQIALFALSFEGFQSDPRDTIKQLAIIYAIAKEMGLDKAQIAKDLKYVADHSSLNAKPYFIHFQETPTELASMNLKIVANSKSIEAVPIEWAE